jgi:hypothetical protein
LSTCAAHDETLSHDAPPRDSIQQKMLTTTRDFGIDAAARSLAMIGSVKKKPPEAPSVGGTPIGLGVFGLVIY